MTLIAEAEEAGPEFASGLPPTLVAFDGIGVTVAC